MSRLQWMPLYSGDLLADTLDLTGAEFGAYMLLILAYWNNGGPIPNDDRSLKRICRGGSHGSEILTRIRSRFFTVIDGLLVHQRIDKELKRAQQAHAGRAAGARRANAGRAVTAIQPEPEPQQDISSKGFLSDLGFTSSLPGNPKQWSREQKKAAWQGKICDYAGRTMPADQYAAFLAAWTADEPWAVKLADEMDVLMRSTTNGTGAVVRRMRG